MMIRLLFCFALCVVAIAPTWGKPLNDIQAASIYALAYGQFGGPLPEKAPRIYHVTQQQLRELAGCEACPVRGYFSEGEIRIDDTLDFSQPYDASILLHEFIHYFQWVAGGNAKDCAEALDRERQAYSIQAHVLQKAGIDARSLRFTANALRCPPEQQI